MTSWSVGLVRGPADGEVEGTCPELQIWKPVGPGMFQRRSSTGMCRHSLRETTFNHVYNVIPTDSMRFESADYFGVFQPPATSSPTPRLHYVMSNEMGIVFSTDTSLTTLQLEGTFVVQLTCPKAPMTSECSIPLVSARVGKLDNPYIPTPTRIVN